MLYLLESQLFGEAGFVISASLVLMACLIASNKTVASTLNSTVLFHIGKISYGLYLLHMICKAIVLKMLGVLGLNLADYLLFVAVLLLSIAVATLSFNTFEKFFLSYKWKFAR
jgi:peptidoglycan/LPS O-acetylase OafA/YrhL